MPAFHQPSQEALARSKALLAELTRMIKTAGGSISFGQYMEHALYAPELGYYSAGAEKFGKLGDFITAPLLTPLFAKTIATAICPTLKAFAEPEILELGAGTGQLALDLLDALAAMDCLPKAYHILEISPDLTLRQQQLLKSARPDYYERMIWSDKMPSRPLQGVILGNEVLDAFPVERFLITENGVAWCRVFQKNGQLQEHFELSTDPALAALLPDLCDLPTGYTSEVSPNLHPWLQTLSQSLSSGLMLFLDYGYGRAEYYRQDRLQGTLRCYYQHHLHTDLYFYPGLQDMTAHVDFTAVAEAGLDAGLKLAGFSTQSGFLLGNMLLEHAKCLEENVADQYKTSQALKTLTLPSEMGEIIKVIGLTKNFAEPLPNFAFQDRRRDL